MVKSDFNHVNTWVFDLDNTLYPPSVNLFAQIETLMNDYMVRELEVGHTQAAELRKTYWETYGTTLAGLMAEHNLPPDPFLREVHDIDFTVLPKDLALRTAITALPGRKIIYTNGYKPYAQNVINACGLDGLFDAIYGIEHAHYRPKPERAAFETIFALDDLDPTRAAMFEDDTRNLAVPRAMGMRTIHVAPTAHPQPHIQYHTANLAAFLSQLV